MKEIKKLEEMKEHILRKLIDTLPYMGMEECLSLFKLLDYFKNKSIIRGEER